MLRRTPDGLLKRNDGFAIWSDGWISFSPGTEKTVFAEKLKMDVFTGVVESGEVNKDGDYIQLRKVCQNFRAIFRQNRKKIELFFL